MKLNKGYAQRLPSLKYKKTSSWQWCSLRKALFTPRGLQEAVSVCTVFPTRSQQGRAHCRTMQRYGLCQTAQWGSEKHPAFPVWEQAAIALLWPHKYFMHSQLTDLTLSMQQGLLLFYKEVLHCCFPVTSTSSWKLQWATMNCHLRQQPWRGGITAEWQICYQILPISTEADMLKHKVNKSLIWYLNSF